VRSVVLTTGPAESHRLSVRTQSIDGPRVRRCRSSGPSAAAPQRDGCQHWALISLELRLFGQSSEEFDGVLCEFVAVTRVHVRANHSGPTTGAFNMAEFLRGAVLQYGWLIARREFADAGETSDLVYPEVSSPAVRPRA
jgi:hypothetical protein